MNCPSCGATNDEQARFCSECGASLGQPTDDAGYSPPPPPPPPSPPGWGSGTSYPPPPPAAVSVPNYLVQSILVTLFCCLPGGIVAIIYAAQVQSKSAAGDHAGAVRASQLARTWCWVSLGVGLAFSALLLIIGLADTSP